MTRFGTLMHREWLQHRFGWMMAALLPLALALVLAAFGQIQLDDETISRADEALPTLMAMAAIAGSMAVIFVVLDITSLIIVAGLARRDYGDRSAEFWLSLPVGHSASLAAPLLVHLVLVPAAALVIGLAGGYVLSLVLVGRFVGVAEWFALPWADIVPASLMLLLRLLAGLPLSTLWLAPLILLVVLLTAWFRRWGWVILAVGVGLGSVLLQRLLGQPLLLDTLSDLFTQSLRAMVHGGGGGVTVSNANEGFEALRALPGWALRDLGHALRELASPLLAGGLVFAAVCFALIIEWRKRGPAATA